MVSIRITYTYKYRVSIWMNLGDFIYERYESVYVTLLTMSIKFIV